MVGITSRGLGCAEPNSPGIYTRADGFEEWLDALGVKYTKSNTTRAVEVVGHGPGVPGKGWNKNFIVVGGVVVVVVVFLFLYLRKAYCQRRINTSSVVLPGQSEAGLVPNTSPSSPGNAQPLSPHTAPWQPYISAASPSSGYGASSLEQHAVLRPPPAETSNWPYSYGTDIPPQIADISGNTMGARHTNYVVPVETRIAPKGACAPPAI